MSVRILATPACLWGFGLLLGCGGRPANPPAPAFAVAPAEGDAPPVVADEVPPDERRPLRADGPVFKSFQELVAQIPKDKQPRPGSEAIIERNDAKAWLAANAAGRAIEFTLHVRGIDIQDTGEGRYSLDLLVSPDPKTGEAKKIAEGIRVDTIKIGDVPCQVIVRGPSPMWTELDSTTARKYRDLKNKQAVFQAVIDETEFQESDRENELILRVLVADPTPVPDAQPADVPKKKEPEKESK